MQYQNERYFLLDIFSVTAAFDGRLSALERLRLPEAFKELTDIYMLRTETLKTLLLNGQLHAAKALCTLDLIPVDERKRLEPNGGIAKSINYVIRFISRSVRGGHYDSG